MLFLLNNSQLNDDFQNLYLAIYTEKSTKEKFASKQKQKQIWNLYVIAIVLMLYVAKSLECLCLLSTTLHQHHRHRHLHRPIQATASQTFHFISVYDFCFV